MSAGAWIAIASSSAGVLSLVLGWFIGRAQSRPALAAERSRADLLQSQLDAREASDGLVEYVAPMKDRLDQFAHTLTTMERQRSTQHGEIAAQLRSAQEAARATHDVAHRLEASLSNNQVRGSWGETQLKRLMESVGLLEGVHYDLQVQIEADSGQRKPDMVINLPDDKHLALDSKVPAIDFDTDDAAGAAKRVRDHIKELAKRDYFTGLDNTPEFTIAFIPTDSVLALAMQGDDELMEFGFSRRIVLASPSVLWAVLKTIAYTWKQQSLDEDVQKVFATARALYDQMARTADDLVALGRSLDGAVTTYNRVTRRIEGQVLKKAAELDAMSDKPIAVVPEIESQPREVVMGELA